jgi:hypothetical protein
MAQRSLDLIDALIDAMHTTITEAAQIGERAETGPVATY